jgi:TrmH family RNA methyltransferase
MKPFRIVVLIAFVFVSIASSAVFISEKIKTDRTIPQITVDGEMIEVSLKATDEELRKISFQETPQDVLAVFLQSDDSVEIENVACDNLCIALDEVQNPGNLGTIMRVADWFGIEHIYCSTTCADVYNPKTVQATMGALSRVKVHYCDLNESLKKLSSDIPIYGTFLDGENIYTQELSPNGVIVMGNEGRGISYDIAKCVTKKILVPSYPHDRPTSESLNVAVATSVVCAEFRRRLQ